VIPASAGIQKEAVRPILDRGCLSPRELTECLLEVAQILMAGFALAVHFVHYRTHGNWHPGATALLTALALLALAFTVYVVYVLEILKLRHVQLLGLARGRDETGSTPLVAMRRARRARLEAERAQNTG